VPCSPNPAGKKSDQLANIRAWVQPYCMRIIYSSRLVKIVQESRIKHVQRQEAPRKRHIALHICNHVAPCRCGIPHATFYRILILECSRKNKRSTFHIISPFQRHTPYTGKIAVKRRGVSSTSTRASTNVAVLHHHLARNATRSSRLRARRVPRTMALLVEVLWHDDPDQRALL
jgi:hypothetical protein